MAADLPNCVVASTNRANDIGPYALLIYKNDPQVWDAIFPWEFPQQAGKEEEESFLRRYFSDVEIHMQGGAHSEGNGFRFLKQVWYYNALWNLNQRVPAVEQWWWQQEDTTDLLMNPETKKFFYSTEAEPSTFFLRPELDMYGEKFLSIVILGIQRTGQRLLEQQQVEKHATTLPAASLPAPSAAIVADHGPHLEATSTHLNNPPANSTKASATLPPITTAPSVTRDAAIAIEVDPLRTRIPSNTSADFAAGSDTPFNPGRRGNSGSRRFSNRVEHFSTRQSHPYVERDHHTPFQSPPNFIPHPTVAYPQSRGPSGGAFNSMHQTQQGPPMPGVPPQYQYGPTQFGPSPMQEYLAHLNQPASGPYPVYMSNNARSGHFVDREFVREQAPNFDEVYSQRGGRRRNSQNTRGGRSRGYNSMRGRGSRGRNSFSHSDQPPFIVQGGEHGYQASNEVSSTPFANRGRRGSMFVEKNWRGGNDPPQAPPNGHITKENIAPSRDFPSVSYQHPGPIQYPKFGGGMRPLGLPKPEGITSSALPAAPFSLPDHNAVGSSQRRLANPDNYKGKLPCSRDTIGVDCELARKLVVFEIPERVPEDEIIRSFNDYAHVITVNRAVSAFASGLTDRNPLVFLHFPDHTEARKFLANKPANCWLNGKDLRVELTRDFWDPGHKSFRPEMHQCALALQKPEIRNSYGDYHRHGYRNTSNSTQASVLPQRTQEGVATPRGMSVERPATENNQSGNTTPTPSGPGTPKKNKDSNKSKSKKPKKRPELRKASVPASVGQNQKVEKDDLIGDTASAGANGDNVECHKDHSTESKKAGTALDTPMSPKLQSGLKQPTFTPTDTIETRLPQTNQEGIKTGNDPVESPKQQTRLPNVDLSPKSKPVTTTADDVTGGGSEEIKDTEPFRAEKKAEEKTQISSVDESLENQQGVKKSGEATDPTKTPPKSDEEPTDDSFHTASGSPDSEKDARQDERDDAAEPALRSTMSRTASGADSSEAVKIGDVAESKPSEILERSASTELSTSPKQSKKAYIPQGPVKPKIAVCTDGSEPKPNETDSAKRSTSGSTVVPTPTFITAPNTPAVVQEAPKDEEAKPPSVPSKKVEKPKGPAQTESLSLFGKKREKKPKSSKKGTLKGNPNQNGRTVSEAASGSTSRAASGATTPNNRASRRGSQNVESTKDGGEDVPRTDSKLSDIFNKPRNSEAESKASSKDVTDAPPVTPDDTPRKSRSKLGHLFSSVFGGQSQSLPKGTQIDEATVAKNLLTGPKAQDHPLGNETHQTKPDVASRKTVGEGDGVERGGAVVSMTEGDVESVASGGETVETVKDIVHEADRAHVADPEVGLGISNYSPEQHDGGQSKPDKKRKKERPKKKKRISNTSDGGLTTQSTPGPETQLPPEMFRFSANSSTPDNQEDDHSDASSHTMDRETPTSELQSPVPSTLARKFSSGNGHLVQAKQQGWKNKRRIQSSRATDITSEPTAEDEEQALWIIRGGAASDNSEHTSQISNGTDGSDTVPRQPGKVWLWIGGGMRDSSSDPPRQPEDEEVRGLALEELERKYVDPSAVSPS